MPVNNNNGPLFFSPSFLQSSALPGDYTVALWSRTGQATDSDPEAILNDQNLVLLFLKTGEDLTQNPAKTTLIHTLESFLAQPMYRKLKMLWVENAAEALIDWRTYTLSVEKKGNTRYISSLTYFNLRNYALGISKGCTIQLNNKKDGFLIKRNNNPEAFELSAAYGTHRIFSIDDTVRIPLHGLLAGCVRFSFNLPMEIWGVGQKTIFGYRGLAQLDVGIRIFFRDPEFPESGDDFYLASHRYPVLNEAQPLLEKPSKNPAITPPAIEDVNHPLKNEISALLDILDPVSNTKPWLNPAFNYYPEKIAFSASMDPLFPLDRQRSYFEFDQAVLATGLPSSFRTNRGYTVHLLPQSVKSRLVFTTRPATLRQEDLDDASFYLTPSGKFEIKIPKYDSSHPPAFVQEGNVICGISGLEYVKISDTIPSYLNFVPDQAAFAPAFVSANALLRDLTGIIESKAKNNRSLIVDTPDQDMPIEETYSRGLGINDIERREILYWVRDVYFPSQFNNFTPAAESEFMGLEIVEEMVNWLRKTLQREVIIGRGQKSLVNYPQPEAGIAPEHRFPTTSWAYFHEGGGATYYGQPNQAVLYQAESSSTEFLDFLEVPAIGLPDSLTSSQEIALETATTSPASLSFPLLPYGNVDPGSLTDMLQLENLLINNFRYGWIRAISEATDHATPLKNAGSSTLKGTTPQGLIATFSPDPIYTGALQIETLQLARNKDKNNSPSLIQMVNIPHDAAFKAVLQSNQLFMVIDDPNTLKDYFSANALSTFAGVTNQIDIEDWLFELGTDHWDKNGTLLVFKFHDKPLMELASQPELWSLPDDFNLNKDMTSLALQNLVDAALENGTSKDPKQRKKYAAIMPAITQANWTGILAFNVAVPLGNLPDPLKALAGGMDPNLFYSQYVGIEVTPVESSGTSLVSKPSSMFALIDYQNNVIPEADLSGYNFHVPYLTVVFRNSLITDFAAEIQLFIEYLFHEKAYLLDSPDGRNMISLKGVAEKQNGKTTYSFGFSGANRFELSRKALQEVEIVKAQFATDPISNPQRDPLDISGRFSFWGRIRFAHLEEFDVLSFGLEPVPGALSEPDYLSMNNLQITLSFKLHTEKLNPPESSKVTDKRFEFKSQQMAFDLKRSGWRSQSLYEKFPLKFKAFKTVLADPNALISSGYMPVNSPLKTVDLGDTWYGIEYDLNLGSGGALTGSLGLVAGILVAWKPEEKGLYLGLKLPGSTGGKKELTIQGLLKIAFKSIRFEVYEEGNGNIGYLLKLKNIVLKFMILSFPPSGQTEFILFGDPRTKEEVPLRKDKLLGWYASYIKK